MPVQFFFEDLPGVDDRNGFGEPRDEDAVMSALMNAEGVSLAKAFRDADSSGKRKLIAALARAVADFEGLMVDSLRPRLTPCVNAAKTRRPIKAG